MVPSKLRSRHDYPSDKSPKRLRSNDTGAEDLCVLSEVSNQHYNISRLLRRDVLAEHSDHQKKADGIDDSSIPSGVALQSKTCHQQECVVTEHIWKILNTYDYRLV